MEYADQFGNRDKMPIINLDENSTLAYFLNDDGEIGKGMYIAAAYQNFINWQNKFLDELIEPYKQSGILHHFVKNMVKTIDVQNANKYEILNFDKVNEEFMEIIFDRTKRNIFTENKRINYLNYRQLIYNFNSIEKCLGEMLLPGKVKFNSIDNLRFVTYCYEGFRGSKSNLLSDFASKYKQIGLSIINKQKIYDIIKGKYQNDELSKIYFSVQSFIYYLTQDNKENDEEIKKVLDEMPEYVNLSKECIDFLENQNLKINELIGAYSYLELLCFKPILTKLKKNYKQSIDGNVAETIKKSFEGKNFKIFTKISLASACRKLISRYLISSRYDDNYNIDNKLDLYLNREELWDSEIWNEKEKFKKDLDNLRKNDLTLGQCFELYNLLGGDEQEAYKGIIVKDDEDKIKMKYNSKENKNLRINKKKRLIF